MKKNNLKIIIISLFLALIATAAIFLYLKSVNKSSVKTDEIIILQANEDIPASTLIEKKMIKEVKVPNDLIFKDYIKDYSKLVGKYTKNKVLKNDGFTSNSILSKNDSEISIKLDKGYRAVSINVTGSSAVSYLIKAGDYVDVASFLPEKKEDNKVVHEDTAKIILQNIKVFAVDKNQNRDDTKNADTTTNDTKDKIPSTFLVTLAVKSEDVEKILLTEEIGTLKLALRPVGKEDSTDTNGTVWEDIVVINDSSNENNEKKNSTGECTGRIVNYTVRKGDTLRTIANAFYGDSEKYTLIKDENNIENENQILTGQVIRVPIT